MQIIATRVIINVVSSLYLVVNSHIDLGSIDGSP